MTCSDCGRTGYSDGGAEGLCRVCRDARADDGDVRRDAAAIVWTHSVDSCGTGFCGMLETPWSFEETVARLVTASGGEPTQGDGYKLSVHFVGTFYGQVFTLYDYKGDGQVHIGGRTRLGVERLTHALVETLYSVTPTPYRAVVQV